METLPLASLCILFYKQEDFVEDTLRGAFSQTYDNLEIVISDDCSPDGTFERIQEMVKNYNGPHKIILNRNIENIGLVRHVNKVLYEISNGDYIFLNGGDDVSLPDRISTGIHYFLQNTDITAETCSYKVIDKNGEIINECSIESDKSISINDSNYILSTSLMSSGVGLSLKRNVLTFFGPMSDDCQTEDSVLRFRALLLGKTLHSKEIGLKYRVHDNNISRHIFRLTTEPIANQYRRDLDKVRGLIHPHLYIILTNKIDFYQEYRRLEAEESCSNTIRRILIRMEKKILFLQYKNTIKKH